MKKVLIIQVGDWWEVLIIDKKIIRQFYQLEDYEDRGIYFLKLSEEYNFTSEDVCITDFNEKGMDFLDHFGQLDDDMEFTEILKLIDTECL